jgi:hypothetical protein
MRLRILHLICVVVLIKAVYAQQSHCHVVGMTMGAVAEVAGSRMVEGGGLVIPAHGLGLAVVHVMLVEGVVKGRPRASITPPVDGRMAFIGFRI